ncbi:type II toxin-antitoxin system VapC family toxin [Hymenobacter coccineus]|uniref:type II toxin-antitoxin system VapC family toxin n=1 Tax=Hymenobacter coccineus TaxID=1908235 RepID=UPI0009F57FD8|nr:type II toxin-antitoxin system VapC family toxin [Hymenobacter coccineus]
MSVFLDTSSLIKLYDDNETGSDDLRRHLNSREGIYLSALTRVEFVSALGRKYRRGELTLEKSSALQQAFEADHSTYGWIDLDPVVLKLAAQLLNRHMQLALRSLDAIQLASALAVQTLRVFITHDHRLHEAAVREGLACWPTAPPPRPAAAP